MWVPARVREIVRVLSWSVLNRVGYRGIDEDQRGIHVFLAFDVASTHEHQLYLDAPSLPFCILTLEPTAVREMGGFDHLPRRMAEHPVERSLGSRRLELGGLIVEGD